MSIPSVLQHLTQLQHTLAKQVQIPKTTIPIPENTLFGAIDVQYQGEEGCAAVVIFDKNGEIKTSFTKKYEATVPYIPSFFAFREGDIVCKLIEDAEKELQVKLAILLIDGHGIAHPRKFGLASYVGVRLDKVTIGVAKDTLVMYEGELDKEQFSTLEICIDDEIVGYALRSRADVKPIFVSAGHLISNEQALTIVNNLTGEYRQLDVLRQADHLARELAKSL